MAIPKAEKLIALAQTGERLVAKDRLHVVRYMMATRPDETNQSIADLCQVSERMIRKDKDAIRREKAQLIREDDIANVIADIAMNFDRQIKDLEASKKSKECKPGTRTYLEHCKTIFTLELNKVAALQNLGYYPKSLGTLTTQKFEFTASVGIMEGEGTKPAAVTARADSDEALEAEFTDVLEPRLLEAPVDATENEDTSATNH